MPNLIMATHILSISCSKDIGKSRSICKCFQKSLEFRSNQVLLTSYQFRMGQTYFFCGVVNCSHRSQHKIFTPMSFLAQSCKICLQSLQSTTLTTFIPLSISTDIFFWGVVNCSHRSQHKTFTQMKLVAQSCGICLQSLQSTTLTAFIPISNSTDISF